MLRPTLYFCLIFLCTNASIFAQANADTSKIDAPATVPKPNFAIPKNMLEIGLNGGIAYILGDKTNLTTYGGGVHIRKALDFIFSGRLDGLYASASSKINDPNNVTDCNFSSTWYSATASLVVSLNSFRFDRSVRNFNLYLMGGGGASSYKTCYECNDGASDELSKITPQVVVGAGMSFRLGKKINIGIEEQFFIATSNQGEGADRFALNDSHQFPNYLSFSNLVLNYNFGNPKKQTEPLYWINPLDGVMKKIDSMKPNDAEVFKDEDEDGVIDALDQDPNTPAGAMVDTKGRALDSDRDGVPDHIDREPFYTPAPGEKVDEAGVVTNPANAETLSASGRTGVTENRVRELIDQALQNYFVNDSRATSLEWFLPMIHFGNGSTTVKYSDYGNLASLARTMKANPTIRLTVIGYSDAVGAETINNVVSYERAKSVIEHLTNNHGIQRERLLLQWKGSLDQLVPTNSSFMNRRVEFRLAGKDDVEMDTPNK